ncbi:MAG: HEAT repeat domain-containing protein [Candidatus Omnitrophica bacterium]|nr:HEAT repeat domain-containing protein [Candidatus Omnitrophota bacterium]
MKRFCLFLMMAIAAIVSGAAMDSLENLSDRIQTHIDGLSSRDWDKNMDALVKIGEPAVSFLISAMNQPVQDSLWRQRRSAGALGRIGSPAAERALLEATHDGSLNIHVRRSAVEALGQIASPQALQTIKNIVQDIQFDVNLRSSGVYALKNFPGDDAVAILKRAMESDEPPIHYRAGEALAEMGSRKATAALLQGIRINPACLYDREVRSAIVNAPLEEALPVLIELLPSEKWSVRSSVVQILEEMGEAGVPALLNALSHSDPRTRWIAVRILSRIQPEGDFKTWLEMLKDRHWMVRNEAAVALVNHPSKEMIAPLIELMRNERSEVQIEAAWILGEKRATGSVDALISLLQEKGDAAWMAAVSLGKIRAQEAEKALLEGLRGNDMQVRRSSAWALHQMGLTANFDADMNQTEDPDDEIKFWINSNEWSVIK